MVTRRRSSKGAPTVLKGEDVLAAIREEFYKITTVEEWLDWLHAKAIEQCLEGDNTPASNLIVALYHACSSRAPVPDWVKQSTAHALDRYVNHEVRTLDEAFRVKRPKGYNLKAARLMNVDGRLVFTDVCDMVAAGAVLDEVLFEAVGKLRGVKKTTASKWYYHHYHQAPYILEETTRDSLPPHLEAIAGHVNWLPTGCRAF